MRWRIFGVVALFIANGEAMADESSLPPPAWIVRGFEAAIADPQAERLPFN